jgi:hypothetical protein
MNANGDANSNGAPQRPITPADLEMGGAEGERHEPEENLAKPSPQPLPDDQPPGF